MLHTVSKDLFTICEALYVSRKARIAYGKTNCLKKIDRACGAMGFDEVSSQACFVYPSMMTMMSWFPVAVLG